LSYTDPSDYDKSLAHIENTAVPGTYTWHSPDKSRIVRLSLDVVDRMQQDVMRGFGAVPRRGAEVGGVLIGSVDHDESAHIVILIDDYELVPIEYKRGPSYLLSDEDSTAFASLVDRLRTAGDPAYQPVGFFRSHTRDATGLGEEDVQLLDQYFPEPDTPVLWIRPYATRVGVAGFLFRENGSFPTEAPSAEFPFRRKDLAPGEAPSARAARHREADAYKNEPSPEMSIVASEPVQPMRPHIQQAPPPAFSAGSKAWYWLPLSFCFLLLGVFLGFLAALSVRPPAPNVADFFKVGMSTEKNGDDIHVKWDRQAPAIRAAQRGVLTIEDGRYSKTLELDPSQLQNGSVVYRRSSKAVRFRLQLFSGLRDTQTETIEWSE
jgi:hypothetical protein